jgi:hypothetical protein
LIEELLTLPPTQAEIDIHCVTRWSKLAVSFSGVLLAELLRRARPTRAARFVSFIAHSERQHSTSLPLDDALALGTLLATHCGGQPLTAEHGGPLRTVVPGRYFYKSLKWLRRIELLPEDRLGYWEAVAGYHNGADPWREERFIASSVTKQQAAQILATRDISAQELLGIDASGRDLTGLKAGRALLRNACFDRCRLAGADFRAANLSNATFRAADLTGALFQGADLEGTDFAGADLRGADLIGASLVAATFIAADRAAIIDSTTRIAPAQLAELCPEQQTFVTRALHNVIRL